jgi:hypothetical protein
MRPGRHTGPLHPRSDKLRTVIGSLRRSGRGLGRALLLVAALPLLVAWLSPLVLLAVVGFTIALGGLALAASTFYEPLLVGLGMTAALSSLCFGYSRASSGDSKAHRVGYENGRLLLAATVMIAIALCAEYARVDLPLLTSPDAHPVAVEAIRHVATTGLAISVGGGATALTLALLWLYWHALTLLFSRGRT